MSNIDPKFREKKIITKTTRTSKKNKLRAIHKLHHNYNHYQQQQQPIKSMKVPKKREFDQLPKLVIIIETVAAAEGGDKPQIDYLPPLVLHPTRQFNRGQMDNCCWLSSLVVVVNRTTCVSCMNNLLSLL